MLTQTPVIKNVENYFRKRGDHSTCVNRLKHISSESGLQIGREKFSLWAPNFPRNQDVSGDPHATLGRFRSACFFFWEYVTRPTFQDGRAQTTLLGRHSTD